MASKFIVFAAALAYANAGLIGAPVATYSAAPAVSSAYISQGAPLAVAHAAPVAIHAPAYGSSQQSVIRSLGGNQAVSTYSKAVDSAFSSVRKFDTRVTNDGLSYAHAPIVSSYASPVVSSYAHAPVVSSYAQAAPVLSSYAHAPVVSSYSHAPVLSSYAQAAPVVSSYAHAPVAVAHGPVSYSPAALVSHASFSGLGVSYGW